MPTYQYACTACDERLEVVQKFSDEPLTECPACQGRLRKVFSAVGVVFKGSGFYKTDSRATNGKAASGKDGGSDGAASTKTESAGAATEKKAEPKAEKSPATTSTGSTGSKVA